MKNAFLALMVSLMALPAFADDQFAGDYTSVDEATAMSQDVPLADDMIDEEFLAEADLVRPHRPPQRPRQVTCVAENRFGRQFAGQGWSRDQAGYRAVQKCRNRSRLPFANCRLVYCNR